jgi:hypothetical protein
MASTADGPFFSVLISAHNRAEELVRCVGSCMRQTFTDFEIVVVDDASTDGTEATLSTLVEPRLRLVRHERNRGISTARATGVNNAAGEWLVVLDSDWELVPSALARLHTLIGQLPPGVKIIRSRIEWDDGQVSPGIMPEGITDYRGRLLWLESLAVSGVGSDAGHCIHRSVFESTNYFTDRRGAMETLWELNLARRERSLWVPDVLIRQHADAPNSYTRDASARRLVPRLLREAPDQLWMAETMLAEHGVELARWAPHYQSWIMESAALEAFLSGQRLTGLRYAWADVRAGGARPRMLGAVVLGVLGARPLARAKAAGRRSRTWRHMIRRDGA